MLHLLWLIPVLPLVGFVVNGLLGTRVLSRRVVTVVGCGTVLLAFLVSVGAVASLSDLEGVAASPEGLRVDAAAHRVVQEVGTWLPLGPAVEGLAVSWGFALDPLSAVMLLVVTGVGFLIHVYSVGYMGHEGQASYARFFAYLNLFMAMMLTLVLGSSLPVLFIGWEGVGLCSYLLIGFYYDRPFDEATGLTCADAGRKAFITNRVGDMGFVLGMLLLFGAAGTLDVQGVLGQVGTLGAGVCTAAALLVFLGVCGKSAQIPLYVWLPDAMAGPTPVSALIHAATMVTAGVYVMCRMAPLYQAAPEAMTVVAVVGGLTALMAAIIGIMQDDIKKVLAYSTVSQLGYMVMAVGVGAFTAGIFHLMTHAFFKALLFLGAGSVIHAMSGEQNIRRMGGLRAHLPLTHLTFAVAVLAIAGVPPFAGFFSKDEILWASLSGEGGSPLLWGVAVLTAGITAFYMTRLYVLVFVGAPRLSAEARGHLHESPVSMTGPLLVLAVGAAFAGLLGVPESIGGNLLPNHFEHYLAPALPEAHHGAGAHPFLPEDAAMGIALLVSLAGIVIAWRLYGRGPGTEMPRSALGRLVKGKFYVDELYERTVLRPYRALCRFSSEFDRRVVDGLVNGTGAVTSLASQLVRLLQTGYVRNYALMFLLGAVVILSYVVMRLR